MTATGPLLRVVRLFLAASLLPAAAGDARAEERPDAAGEKAQPGIRIERLGDATRMIAVLPGDVVEFSPARSAAAVPVVFVLVRPHEPADEVDLTGAGDGHDDDEKVDLPKKLPPCSNPVPLALYRIEATDPPQLESLMEHLPSDVTEIGAADLDGDGGDEPLLRRAGEICTVRAGALEVLLRDPDLSARTPRARGRRPPQATGSPFVADASLGRLRLIGPQGDRTWDSLAEIELPIDATVAESRGMRVRSEARLIGSIEGGPVLFATPPKTFGQHRMRLSSISLAPSGEATSVESWMRLPEPEQMLENHFLIIDGRALLLVATKPADRLDLFGEKRLRLYALEHDRSRLGRPPVWQVESRMNLWQEAHPELVDTDGDGRLDLVIGYWKGLSDDRVVLDVYRRLDSGWFDASVLTTTFEVKDADRSLLLYGADPTGDGRPDLLLNAGGRLAIHAGRPPAGGRDLVERRPLESPQIDAAARGSATVSVRIGSDEGLQTWSDTSDTAPVLVDLDGDGDDELLQLVSGGDGLDELHIVDLTPRR